jgi:hypothetical protein
VRRKVMAGLADWRRKRLGLGCWLLLLKREGAEPVDGDGKKRGAHEELHA